MEGKMMICGRACREPPTTLTASWGGRATRAEKGGARGEQRAEPRWRHRDHKEKENQETTKKGVSDGVCPFT